MLIKTTLIDLSKVSNVVKKGVKKTVYEKLVKTVNAIQTIDTSDVVQKADYNEKNVEIERNILPIS